MATQAVLPTYRAILRGNYLEWRGDVRERIPTDQAVAVYVTVLDELPVAASEDIESQGARMAAALGLLAEINALGDIGDAGAWERTVRVDRILPGREV